MSFSDCRFLEVSLTKNALASKPSTNGTYELSEIINGKPSWKSATRAIWYYSGKEAKFWMIGLISNMGTKSGGIYAADPTESKYPQEVPNDKWKYHDGSNWQQASSDEITIQCAGKKEQDQIDL